MEEKEHQTWAEALQEARLKGTPIEQISHQVKEFQRSEAYAIQEKGMALRKAAGETCLGLKMGLTSKAKREQMGLESPLYGELTDKMQIPNGGSTSLKGQIHPKIEPEMAFLINGQLGESPTREQVLEAVGGIYPCLEILDSRYRQFKYFSMEDVIADNSSSSLFILGPLLSDFEGLDLKNLHLKMTVNGELAGEGKTSAISGDPVVSVIQLCELLATRNRSLPAQTLVLAGAATPAVSLEPQMKIEMTMESVGSVSVVVE